MTKDKSYKALWEVENAVWAALTAGVSAGDVRDRVEKAHWKMKMIEDTNDTPEWAMRMLRGVVHGFVNGIATPAVELNRQIAGHSHIGFSISKSYDEIYNLGQHMGAVMRAQMIEKD